MIVVLTAQEDVTADVVVAELNRRRCPVFRLDPGAFPKQVVIAATMDGGWSGAIQHEGRRLDLRDVRSVFG